MDTSSNVDREQLRRTMRAWSSGVTVVTAAHAGERHGMTVSSFTSVAIEPPLIIISLQSGSRTHALISQSGGFAVTVLSAQQQAISERFAGLTPNTEDRLAGLETETLVTGAPCLKGGLAYLDCRVVQTIPTGGNTLFLAEVVATRSSEGTPLIYHNQRYYRLLE